MKLLFIITIASLLGTGTSAAADAPTHCQVTRGDRVLASFDAPLGEESLTELAITLSGDSIAWARVFYTDGAFSFRLPEPETAIVDVTAHVFLDIVSTVVIGKRELNERPDVTNTRLILDDFGGFKAADFCSRALGDTKYAGRRLTML